MRGTGKIVDGQLFLSAELHKFIEEHNDEDCDVEIYALSKPEHYLYRYLFGYLIKDIATHSGESEDEVKQMMKERFATDHVKEWSEVPPRHREKCQRFERVKEYIGENGEHKQYIERYYTKSLSQGAMTHEELKEFVTNVDHHFFDFLEGAIQGSKARQMEAMELRKKGMMDKKELKKYEKGL